MNSGLHPAIGVLMVEGLDLDGFFLFVPVHVAIRHVW